MSEMNKGENIEDFDFTTTLHVGEVGSVFGRYATLRIAKSDGAVVDVWPVGYDGATAANIAVHLNNRHNASKELSVCMLNADGSWIEYILSDDGTTWGLVESDD